MHQSNAATLGFFLTALVHARARRHQPLCRWLIHRAPSPPLLPPEVLWRAGSAAVSAAFSPLRGPHWLSTHAHTRTPARLHISACSRRWCEFLNTLITVLDLVRACLQNCIFGLLMLENKPSLDSAGGFSLPLAGGAPVFAHGAVLLTVEHLCSCCVHAHYHSRQGLRFANDLHRVARLFCPLEKNINFQSFCFQ